MQKTKYGVGGTAPTAKHSREQLGGSVCWIGPTSFLVGMAFMLLLDMVMTEVVR